MKPTVKEISDFLEAHYEEWKKEQANLTSTIIKKEDES